MTAPTVSNNGGTAIAFGSTTSITFVNGEATVSGGNNGVMRLYLVQTKTLAVTEGTRSSTGNDALTVAVSAGALGKFAWSLISSNERRGLHRFKHNDGSGRLGERSLRRLMHRQTRLL